jgi:CHAT domain-containing protein/tetratricopeptide (TPR) repeat protein
MKRKSPHVVALLTLTLVLTNFPFAPAPVNAQFDRIRNPLRRRPTPTPTPQATPQPTPETRSGPVPRISNTTPTTTGATTTSASQTAGVQTADARGALRRGKSLLRRGRASEAFGQLEAALRLYTSANDDRGRAAALDAFGDLYERQGQYETARGFYEQAHEAYSRSAQSGGAGAVVTGVNSGAYNANLMFAKIGDMYYRQNRIADARAAYSRMTVTRPSGSARSGSGLFGAAAGIAMGGGSASSVASGVTGAALEIRRAYETYRQLITYSTFEIGMGRIDYANNDLDASRRHFQNALDAAGGSGLNLIARLGQTKRFRIAARTGLGDVAFRQNRFSDAVRLYTEAAAGARSDNRLDLMWPAQRGLGRARWAMASSERNAGRQARMRDEALAAYREALRTIETLRAGSLRSDEARSTFLATTADVFDEASGYMAEMALLNMTGTPNGGALTGRALEYGAESFRVVEQGRARSLLDLLAESGAEITEGVPPELLERKRANLDRQQEIAAQLGGSESGESEQQQSASDLEAELERLQTEMDAIENQIRASNPRYANLTQPQPLTLAEVQQRILSDDTAALLEYSLGAERSYLWAVTRDSASLYRLPARAQIDEQVARMRTEILPRNQEALIRIGAQRGINLGGAPANNQSRPANTPSAGGGSAAGNAGAFAAASNGLYQSVLQPAAANVGERRLIVVADGSLNFVPFGALVTAPGGTDYPALPFLIKTNEVVNAPSASVLALIMSNQAANRAQNRAMLIVADPVFTTNDPRLRGARGTAQAGASAEATRGIGLGSAVADVTGSAPPPAQQTPSSGGTTPTNDNLQIARLEGSRAEAEQISGLARAAGARTDVWLDLEASEANIRTRDARQYGIVHVATHGILNSERPQFSGLIFSLVGNRDADGFLRTDEVFNVRLGSPLVMLSACVTGLGREKRGEGVIGLARAFMYAGAPTVGVTLWQVGDRSTVDLMNGFYRRLLARQSPQQASAALRAAQIEMIEGRRYSQPFFWSPFVLVGDWR